MNKSYLSFYYVNLLLPSLGTPVYTLYYKVYFFDIDIIILLYFVAVYFNFGHSASSFTLSG